MQMSRKFSLYAPAMALSTLRSPTVNNDSDGGECDGGGGGDGDDSWWQWQQLTVVTKEDSHEESGELLWLKGLGDWVRGEKGLGF